METVTRYAWSLEKGRASKASMDSLEETESLRLAGREGGRRKEKKSSTELYSRSQLRV